MTIYLGANTDSAPNCIDVGLVNNMPDSALVPTERQFRSLLERAADRLPVRLSFYALRNVPRTDSGLRHINSYCQISDLWNSRLDGLIVTGTEARALHLMDEPYWYELSQLIEWAE